MSAGIFAASIFAWRNVRTTSSPMAADTAQRSAAECRRLVLLPRSRLRAHHEHVAHRRQHGEGRDSHD